MAFISETLQMRRLTESGVNIKTTYIVDGTLRYRSTDGTCQTLQRKTEPSAAGILDRHRNRQKAVL